MSKLSISLACGPYDRVQAIRDGRIGIQGCDVNCLALGPEELFFRAHRNSEFDVCELSMSSYLIQLSQGRSAYTAVPVFPSRSFRHSAIYVNSASGITRPEDLKGRRVGAPEYQLTAVLWVRGLLEDEYGVAPADFCWLSGGINEPGRVEKLPFELPGSIRIDAIPSDDTLDAMLLRGEIDALISPRAPRSFVSGDLRVRRLFGNYADVERAYFEKTRIFPIMHVIGIRNTLVKDNPWLANSVVSAFVAAKALALEELNEVAALRVTLPWLGSQLEETRRVMGDDFWPYGVEANRITLEKMLGYAHRHGTAARLLPVEELFIPSTQSMFKV